MRFLFRLGQAQGGLKMGQGPVVVAEQGQDLAEGPVNVGHRGVAQGQGGFEVAPCLGIGEDPASSLARLAMGLRSPGRSAGEGLVVGDHGPAPNVGRARRRAGQDVGHPAVEQPAAGKAQPLVGHVAQPSVGEVVADVAAIVGADLDDQATVDELVESVDRLAVGSSTGRLDGFEIERPTDHRRGRHDLARDRADRIEPGVEQRDDPVRHPILCPVRSHERLGDVQRQALRAFEQRIHERRLDRPAEGGGCQRPHLVPIESSKGDANRQAIALRRGEDVGQHARRQLFGAPGDKDARSVGPDSRRARYPTNSIVEESAR